MPNTPETSPTGGGYHGLSDPADWLTDEERCELTARARSAVARQVADICTAHSLTCITDGPVLDPAHLAIAAHEAAEPHDRAEAVTPFHVRSLLETAAAAADLPAEDLIDIVRAAAPHVVEQVPARRLRLWADEAVDDFQRLPARRLDPLPDCSDTQFLAGAVAPIIERGRELPDGLRQLAEAAAWSSIGSEIVHASASMMKIAISGGRNAMGHAVWSFKLIVNENRRERIAMWEHNDGAPDVAAVVDKCIGQLREVGAPEGLAAAQALQRHQMGISVPVRAKPAPVDLWQRHEAPEMPAGVLPAVVEQFAIEHGAIMGADAAGLAMSALAACAGAISDDIAIQVKQHDPTWRENTRLWIGLVGMPSTKKTPIMSAAMRPLRRLDTAMATRNAEAMRAHNALDKKDRDRTPPPVQPRLVVQDATVEALQEVLKDSPHGVISMQDELTGWFGAMDKYTPGKGAAADRAFWLQAFNGGAYSLHRIARGSTLIPNLSIGLLGGIQPEPLRKIAGDSVDDGLVQRFLPVMLRSATIGSDTPTGAAVAAYDGLIERLTRLKPLRGPGNLSAAEPVRFGTEARQVRERMEGEHVLLVQSLESVSPKLAAHFGKHDGIFARLCLLFHCVDAAETGIGSEIAGDTAERVARFMTDFIRPSAIAFYAGMLGMSAGHEDLMALAAFIVSDGLTEITAREVQRSTRQLRHVTAEDARLLCEKLEAFAWLEPLDPRQRSNSPRWRVAPEVHAMFAERGRAEAGRRAAARQALSEAFGS